MRRAAQRRKARLRGISEPLRQRLSFRIRVARQSHSARSDVSRTPAAFETRRVGRGWPYASSLQGSMAGDGSSGPWRRRARRAHVAFRCARQTISSATRRLPLKLATTIASVARPAAGAVGGGSTRSRTSKDKADYFSEVATSLNSLLRLVPSADRAPIRNTAIREAIRAYSIAVAPS